jgi:hypothetical protein
VRDVHRNAPRIAMRCVSRYFLAMSEKTLVLLEAFDALPPEEKLDFANAVMRRLPPVDSGPLDDEVVAKAGDGLAAMLQQEEDEAKPR